MATLAPVSISEKKEWVEGVGKDTYIADYAKFNSNFFNTSCLLTAAVLRYRLSGKLWWNEIYYSEDPLEHFPILPETFQVGFGEEGDYDEHIFTFHKGMAYDSFYNVYDWKAEESVCPLNIIDVYRNKLCISDYVITIP